VQVEADVANDLLNFTTAGLAQWRRQRGKPEVAS
jgi:hypothetical protein